MSNPTLEQITKLISNHDNFMFIHKEGKMHYIECEKSVELFGNVEVKDIGFSLSLNNHHKTTYNACKVSWSVFI